MKKLGVALSTVALVVALVAIGRSFRQPRHPVTIAELLATLPPELNPPLADAPDAQKRYAALVSLGEKVAPSDVDGLRWVPKDASTRVKEARVAKKYGPRFNDLEALLKSGPLQVPSHNVPSKTRQALLELDRAVWVAASDAIVRRDAPSVLRLCLLDLHIGASLQRAGGLRADQRLARTVEWDALTAIHEAEWNKGLSDEGRGALLREVKPESGSNPDLAEAFGRNLRTITVPYFANLSAHPERLPRGYGSFDAMDTIRLYASVYLQARSDAMSRDDWPWENTASLLAEIAQSLEAKPRTSATPNPLDALNLFSNKDQSNAYGRKLASESSIVTDLRFSRQLAAYHNLVRAILLLRHGKPAVLRDPLGHGNLQVDTRRRWVWSVGMNGVDDHGSYGRPGTYAGDLCYRY